MRLAFLLGLFTALCLATAATAREWSDASGKFRIQAELIAVHNGKAVLEKTDGSIISVPVEKLSAADQEFLKSQAASAPAPVPNAPMPSSPMPSTAAAGTAANAHAILNKYCYRCHGEDGTSEGGFNFVLNLPKLVGTYVTAKDSAHSLIYERMTATNDSAMPPIGEEPRPSPEELAALKAWIESGAPPLATTAKPRDLITNDQLIKYIQADLRKSGERSRRFLRYFTLTHLYNLGESEEELQTYRNAFAKLINSLSWNTEIIMPVAIDPAKTIYRVDIREVQWSSDTWEEIEDANPYFLAMATPDALECYDNTQTRMPYVRIDWFVFAASKPPLYHTILGIPETDTELEQNLRVNVEANIEQEKVARAGFNRSGVSQNNRLIEHHQAPYGSYWKSYDFGGNTGPQNLFEHPLGPDGDDPFKHDGGELIFTLPNGLQGYMLVDDQGRRIDKGPIEIVSDPKRPDKSVTNGVSCMSCHYTGVIPKADEIGPAVRANLKAFENAEDILALYPEGDKLSQLYEQDAKRFSAAMKKIGVSSLSRSGEPISTMAARFEQELDLRTVACEFGLTASDFEQRLEQSVAMGRSFGALRTSGGTIKRDVFAKLFIEAAIEFRLTVEGSFSTPRARIKTIEGDKIGEVRSFSDLTWGVDSMAFSPNGGYLAIGKPDRALLMFDVLTSTRLAKIERLEILEKLTVSAFTPNGERLLTGGSSGNVQVWEVSKEGQLRAAGQFPGHSQRVNVLAISGDSRLALSGGDEQKVRLWQIDSGKELATFTGFSGPVRACWVSANGKTGLATDGGVLLHLDLQKLQVTKTSQLTRSSVLGRTAAISPDGKLVAITELHNLRVWAVKTMTELPRLESKEIQTGATFTPDSTRLITGARRKINVWDMRKFQRIMSLPCLSSNIEVLAVSPDNKHVAATNGHSDGTVSVFRIPTADE